MIDGTGVEAIPTWDQLTQEERISRLRLEAKLGGVQGLDDFLKTLDRFDEFPASELTEEELAVVRKTREILARIASKRYKS